MIYDCYELRMAVIKEHEKVFKKANLENQIESYNSEYDEMIQTTEKDLMPFYADMFIAGSGVSRFARNIGHSLCLMVWEMVAIDDQQRFADEVLGKMEINKKRKWKYVKGKYTRLPEIIVKCKNCGKEFVQVCPKHKFCSNKCRSSYNCREFTKTEEGKKRNHEKYLQRKIKMIMGEENEKES